MSGSAARHHRCHRRCPVPPARARVPTPPPSQVAGSRAGPQGSSPPPGRSRRCRRLAPLPGPARQVVRRRYSPPVSSLEPTKLVQAQRLPPVAQQLLPGPAQARRPQPVGYPAPRAARTGRPPRADCRRPQQIRAGSARAGPPMLRGCGARLPLPAPRGRQGPDRHRSRAPAGAPRRQDDRPSQVEPQAWT